MAKTILLVVRDEQIVRGLTVLLESEGYLVHTARNGREALRGFQEAVPDLVLLEVAQPPELSYEEARLLKQASPRTPVILMTETPLREPDRALGFQAGVDGFIPKPQAFPELLAYLEEKLRAVEEVPGERAFSAQAASGVLLATCPECRARFKTREGKAPETDLLLPGLHGFDLCQEIKARFKIPVVMMTGVYKSLQYQLEGRWRYGADEFLVKPFTPEELVRKIADPCGGGLPDRERGRGVCGRF